MLSRKLGSIFLFLVFLVTPVTAQVVDIAVPDAGVRGYGVVRLSNDGLTATFDINVARCGNQFIGGFSLIEDTTANAWGNIVVCKQVKWLEIKGNTAVVTGIGYWNRMEAEIRLEVLDSLAGDYLHIVAKPLGPLTIIYDHQGGVIKGDITVFGNTSCAFAKGYGLIKLHYGGIGRFDFHAATNPLGCQGTIKYAEYSPLSTNSSLRPSVCIDVPMVQFLRVDGRKAVLQGLGAINGRKAKVTVTVEDNIRTNSDAVFAIPDFFQIEAVPFDGSREYRASGKLASGDIIVGPLGKIP